MLQKNIIKKYIKNHIDTEKIAELYQKYKNTFHNLEKIQHIKDSKEEQYQEGFLRDLFCDILGYTINPEPNFNLITEKKNESDSRKADGAIIIDGKVLAVIELKGCDTTDLSKVENQAFGYKAHNPTANLVIISNFAKLRLYIEDASDFLEFNIFAMPQEQFELLYLCLSLENVKSSTALKLKKESVSAENSITDKLYADYSTFKRALFADICQLNASTSDDMVGERSRTNKLTLFKKTQKLLDRILFVLFCEDRGLLPENSVAKIIDQWQKLKELDAYQPLYNRFKNYFDHINTGYKSETDPSYVIFAYNGGLFKPDEILDNIKISDDVLFIHTKKLYEYDFESEVSVDILGHIFEHSLTEIEEIQEDIRNQDLENSVKEIEDRNQELGNRVSKRKKDGVFYTPAYITKYIVENTIGKLCDNKKTELGINDETFAEKRRNKNQKAELDQKLKTYREWLLSLKICDPACGSGAFLNAALQFLKAEHALIDELTAKIYGDTLIFQEVENAILENNLYGVDINEESVEIAKLSLWLHTAQKGRKLSTLSNNIKCGNSLIDAPAIAGEKAFCWEKEFPEVFGEGGFDVVIGNPPYVNMVNILDEKQRKFYQSHYKTVKNKSDLYSIFTEKSSHLLKSNGQFGFIFSNSWMGTESFSSFRDFLAKDVKVAKLVQLPPGVFADATVTTVLCFYENITPTEDDFIEIETCVNQEFVSKGFKLSYKQVLQNPNTSFSFERTIELNKVKTVPLGEIASFSLGIKTSDDKRFIFSERKDDDCYLFLRGRNIKRWCKPENNEWLWYKPELICEKPGGRPRIFENFVVDKKIVIQDMATEINATLDYKKYLCNDKVNIIFETDERYSMEFILALLNSRLINVWFKKIYTSGLEIKVNQLRTIPIPVSDVSHEQIRVALSSLADKMLTLNADLQKSVQRFLKRVQENLNPAKISSTLENFYTLEFSDFVKELAKQKVKLSLKQQDEWEEYFAEYKTDCVALSEEITATDNEINCLVYKLYDLTDEEIAIVEGK
ncbi:MAG: N-6 DNA methylase [Treponema sp.]|nr:N-6 DNA methylase [Treponema sp.]